MSAAPSVASACSACGRTFDGPQPKRPSSGSRSAGIVMLMCGSASQLSWPPAGPRREPASGGGAGGPSTFSGGGGLGDLLGLDGVPALDVLGLARIGPDVAG